MTAHDTRSTTVHWTSVQGASLVLGEVFLVFGVLGFIPGITTDYDLLKWVGHESGAMLLGVFQVSVLHNLIHAAIGVAGLVMARTASAARTFLLGGGVIFGVLWLYGVLFDKDGAANFIPVDRAGDVLHLVLAFVMIGLGLLLGYRRAAIGSMTRPKPPNRTTV